MNMTYTRTRNRGRFRGGTMDNGYYDMSQCSKVYCFSDLEGYIPSDLQTIITNALHDIGDGKVGFVFCGDLLDRGCQEAENKSYRPEES